MQAHPLYCNTSQALFLPGLKNGLVGGFVTDAGVSIIIRDANDNSLDGVDWPLKMTEVSIPDNVRRFPAGTYRAILPSTLAITPGNRYYGLITAIGSDGLKAEFAVRFIAKRYWIT